MKANFYLVITSNGSVKAVKTRPSIRMNEISVGMSLTIPDKVFQRPMITAEITIPDEVAMPSVITAEVTDNIKQAIETSTGLEVKLNIIHTDESTISGAQI